MSRCKGCGAEIDWVRMKSGKSMPVDPEPVFVEEGGNQVFITDEGDTITGTATESKRGEVAFVPHWATCPAYKQFKSLTGPISQEIKDSEYIVYTVRKTTSGQRYVVVHDGFDVLAAIMPMQVVTQEFLADLSEFQALCTEQYYREKDRADAAAALADTEEQEAEQIGMEDVQE